MNLQIQELVHSLPDPECEVIDGVKWGRCDQLFTPAYWKIQYHMYEDVFSKDFYRVSDNLIEEICACILGGYGMRSELGLIAFERLRNLELLKAKVSYKLLLTALSVPLATDDKFIRYRFPKQKAKFLFEFFNRNDLHEIPEKDDLLLREWLLNVKGIGMKTASWITRNWLGSDKVAILDIHIYRAGLLAGFFDSSLSIEKDYRGLEKRYLDFSLALQVSPANLDSLIWLQLKMANNVAIGILKSNN